MSGLAGAVLTGGRSTRMGRDKALVEVDGTPMALRVARALGQGGADPVVAVGGDGEALRGLGLAWHPDDHPGEGPLGGLLTALAALAPHSLVAVAATDLADLTGAEVVALVAAVEGHDVALALTDRPEPLCGVWRAARCRPLLEEAFQRGERAVHRAMVGLRVAAVPVQGERLRNVNVPGDLDR